MRRTPKLSPQRATTAVRYTGWVMYPGSFDPVTHGHIDLIRRALKVFPGVLVAVAKNPEKQPLFQLAERVAMLTRATRTLRRVAVESFDALTVDYAESRGIATIIRGVRQMTDFEYEFQLALTNRKLNPRLETVYLMPSERYAYLSSRLIKAAAHLGADVTAFVPPFVAQALKARLRTAARG